MNRTRTTWLPLRGSMRRVTGYAMVWLVMMLLQSPLLLDGRPGILDTPVIAHVCRQLDWRHPLRIMDVMGFGNQARPLQIVTFLPALFWDHARVYHLVQNGVVLLLTITLLMNITWSFTHRAWLVLIISLTATVTSAYTPNWFTLWTMEPYMLFGICGLLFVWVRLLGAARVSRGAWWGYNGLGVMFAAYAIGVKEAGLMAFVVTMLAAAIIAWNNRLTVRETLRRAWPTLIAAELACAAVLIKFALISKAYDAGGSGGYRLAPEALLRSLQKFGMYFIDAAPYAWLALLAWCALAWYVSSMAEGGPNRAAVRTALAGAAVFFVIAFGMAAIYVPWQVFDARYLLVSSTSCVMAAWLTAQALLLTARTLARASSRLVVRGYAALIIALIILHTCYVIMVGPLSEGIARHQFAAAYDEMFKYVAQTAPTNGTVYFLMDWQFPEARENTRYSLDIFYHRPDIQAVFPTNVTAFVEPGLVVVSEYAFPMNYTRMPVHHEARKTFMQTMQPRLRLRELGSFIYDTPIWYAREEHNAVQYSSFWGLPAFWGLKSGTYRFGWCVYWCEGRLH